MGGISSSVGLFSGINSAQLIDQLLSIEARPRQLVQQRVVNLQQQRAAFLDINSALLGVKTAATKFRTANSFNARTATSSDPEALSATASNGAAEGTYTFSVKRLVSTQKLLSRGFADSATGGVGATSFTFEIGGGSVGTDTRLSDLNGGQGIERGKIVVRDATGASATVDLSTTATVGDVLDAINTASGISVRASVSGDKLVVADTNTSGSGSLTISNAAGYNTATSLGIAKTATAGFGQSISGDNIRTISGATALATLNDGTGVNIRDGAEDLVITDREGSIHRVKLGEITTTTGTGDEAVTTVTQARATTVQDVINAINSQANGKVTAALNSSRTGLVLTDTTGATTSNLIVRSGADGRTTAKDLGIETSETGVAAATVSGGRLISGLNSTLVSSLRGGQGLTESALSITDRNGLVTSVTIGASALSGSVTDVIDNINTQLAAAGNNVRIGTNRAGNGLSLSDTLSVGTGDIAASGAAADQLGITASGATGGSFNGANIQSRWVSRATQLASLNGGKGIGTGTIRITDAAGGVATLNIGSSLKNVDDLVKFINAAGGISVQADINANGDGIVIRQEGATTGTLKIEDVSGTVAKSLNLVGTDDDDGGVIEINGSYEREVTFGAGDSLDTVVNKINSAGVGVSASVIRDGSGGTPFRLSLTSQRSGAIGRAVVDTKDVDLGLTTLTRGDDSLAFFGADDPARAVLLAGSSNTLDGVVQGVTIDLKQTSDDPIEVVVTRDTGAVEKAADDFVKAFNTALDRIAKYDKYNPDTNTSGVLFGDSTVSNIRNNLLRTVQSTADGVGGSMTRLFQVGIKIGDGGRLTFDSAKLRSALEQDPEAVEKLVSARALIPREQETEVSPGITVRNTSTTDSFTELGVAEKVGELITSLTSSVDGTITRRGRTIDTAIESSNDRIGQLTLKLEAKRARLERQFVSMEQAIASLQSQSSAISSIRR